MDNLPEFVTENETEPTRRGAHAQLTGWETVIFELDDEEPVPARSPSS